MTHPTLSALAAHAAWEAERAELATRAERLQVQTDELVAEREAANTKWRQAAEKAEREGKPIPAQPAPPDARAIDWAWSRLRTDERAHQSRRAQVLAECAPEALAVLAEREEDRWERLAELAPILAELVAEARADATLARDLVQAQDRVAGLSVRPSRAERVNTRPELAKMLDAATGRRSLLTPAPLTPREPRIQSEASGYGIVRDDATGFGYADSDRPPPAPMPRWMADRMYG